jgi:glycosyltransferase involved in cell wall biosynthesis
MEHRRQRREAPMSSEPTMRRERAQPTVSVVIPVFNEEQVLPTLFERLTTVLGALDTPYDVWLVNDGSTDGSLDLITAQCVRDPHFHVVDLSRNFGHAAALTAGLDFADGDVTIIMDADLQDPPELVEQLISKYRDGFDVVQAQRSSRPGEGMLKRATAWLYYRLLRASTETEIVPDTGEFCLLARDAVIAIRELRESSRLMRGIVAWVGFRRAVVRYDRRERVAGETKYPFGKMVRLAVDGLLGFSLLPLRAATLLGLVVLVFTIAYAAYAFYVGYWLGHGIPGWTSFILFVATLNGALLVALGIIGEYVGRIYNETRHRPLYIVRRESSRTLPTPPERVTRTGPASSSAAESPSMIDT